MDRPEGLRGPGLLAGRKHFALRPRLLPGIRMPGPGSRVSSATTGLRDGRCWARRGLTPPPLAWSIPQNRRRLWRHPSGPVTYGWRITIHDHTASGSCFDPGSHTSGCKPRSSSGLLIQPPAYAALSQRDAFTDVVCPHHVPSWNQPGFRVSKR